ncbi:MAG: DUF4833 domain-containing protein [Planctomycetes bacterium]|nr:DUF4833 domain-containing protein [Planctomycetota bacterium]
MKRKTRLVRRLLVAAVPLVLAVLALAYLLLRSAPGDSGPTLFIIQRNKNANEVHYDVRVGPDGALAGDPVVAYWIMKTEGGRREELTFPERKWAYGFEVLPPGPGGEREMKLVAWEDRTIRLTKTGGRWRALTKIDGKDAYLTRLFIQSEEGGATPKVLWVDLFGEAVDGGKEVKEHVVKK